jgi:hypothetical protein
MKEIPLTKGYVALVDDVDYPKLSVFRWFVSICGVNTYAARHATGDSGRFVRMQNEILTPPTGMLVDHIDGNGLNNCRVNLRICDECENRWNVKLRSTNTSGFKGVTLHRPSGKWHAQIRCRGKRIYLGSFDDINDAAVRYREKAEELHGQFAKHE